VAKSIWKSKIRKDASKKALGSHNKLERGFHTKKRKNISDVNVRSKIDSGLKTNKFCDFTSQKLGLIWNHLIDSREDIEDFTVKS